MGNKQQTPPTNSFFPTTHDPETSNKLLIVGEGAAVTDGSFMEPYQIQGASLGSDHCLVIVDGNVWGWGNNNFGQIGNEYTWLWNQISKSPIKVLPQLRNVIKVSCGAWHSAAVTREGHLFTWGLGSNGELGFSLNPLNSFIDQKTQQRYLAQPTLVENLGDQRMVNVACGGKFTLALAENDKMYSSGEGKNGALGHGTVKDSPHFKQIQSFELFCEIAVGWQHCLAITRDGELYIWGNPYSDISDEAQAITQPQKIEMEEKVEQIACGNYHNAILADWKLYTWGGNGYGQLGYDTSGLFDPYFVMEPMPLMQYNHQVQKIICGNLYTVILLQNGDVYGWGCNHHMQFGPEAPYESWRHTWVSSGVQDVECSDQMLLMLKGGKGKVGDNPRRIPTPPLISEVRQQSNRS